MKIPCTYPVAIGPAITTGIGSTPKIVAAFRGKASSTKNIIAKLVAMQLLPYDASDNGYMTFQLIGNVTNADGVFVDIDSYNTQISTTTTTYIGGKVAATKYFLIGTTRKGEAISITTQSPEDMGLYMEEEQIFVLIAQCSAGITSSLLWSVNWTESDEDYATTKIRLSTEWQELCSDGLVEFQGSGVYVFSHDIPAAYIGMSFSTGDVVSAVGLPIWAKSDTSLNSTAVVSSKK